MAAGQPDNLPLLVDIAFELVDPYGELRLPAERLTVRLPAVFIGVDCRQSKPQTPSKML